MCNCAFLTVSSISSCLHEVSSGIRALLLTCIPSTYHNAWLIVGVTIIFIRAKPSPITRKVISAQTKGRPCSAAVTGQARSGTQVSGLANALSTAAGLPPTTSLVQSIHISYTTWKLRTNSHLLHTFQVARYRCRCSGPEMGTHGPT